METQNKLTRVAQSERLEQIRTEKRLTSTEFATLLGIKPASYSDIKRCKNGISRKLQDILSQKLNINIDWLVSGNGAKYIDPPERNDNTQGKRHHEYPHQHERLTHEELTDVKIDQLIGMVKDNKKMIMLILEMIDKNMAITRENMSINTNLSNSVLELIKASNNRLGEDKGKRAS